MEQAFTFANCAVQARSQRSTADQWEPHKEKILSEYAKYGLQHVMTYMDTEYDFVAR